MLKVENLTCARGGMPVLSKVGFTVEAGQALVLWGPNGIGKTTLLRTLAGLQPAIAGEVAYPEDQGAYASHADGVKAALTVKENLQFWAEVYGEGGVVSDTSPGGTAGQRRHLPAGRRSASPRVTALSSVLEAFNLDDLSERMGGTLSAGQRRRLGLARLALIGRKVLFLDEPTVSLDRASMSLFTDWLKAHLGAGGIAVIATHIDLGLDAPELDLTLFKAAPDLGGGADEAFL